MDNVALPGEPEQIHKVPNQIRAYLDGCPVDDDVILIASEFATNAAMHSDSRMGTFAVRVEQGETSVYIEVEDAGGSWIPKPADGRPHGLDIVTGLAKRWGVRGSPGRTVWARVEF